MVYKYFVTIPCYGSSYGMLQDKIRVNVEWIRSLERGFLFSTYDVGSLKKNLLSLEFEVLKNLTNFLLIISLNANNVQYWWINHPSGNKEVTSYYNWNEKVEE